MWHLIIQRVEDFLVAGKGSNRTFSSFNMSKRYIGNADIPHPMKSRFLTREEIVFAVQQLKRKKVLKKGCHRNSDVLEFEEEL